MMRRRLGFYFLRGAAVGDGGDSSVGDGGVGSCGCTSWRLAILLLFCGREEVLRFHMGFLPRAMVMAPVWIGWWEKSSEEYFAATPWFIGGAFVPARIGFGLVACSHLRWFSYPFGFFVAGRLWDSWVLDASDPSLPVDCLPARSAFQQHVDPDMLLKTAPKKLVLRQGGGRHQAGSSSRRRRERPGVLKDWNVFSISFKGVFALWAVITEY